MQVSKVNVVETPKFKPRAFTITIESEDEARALHAIFSYSPNADLIGTIEARRIRQQIDCGQCTVNGIIANGVHHDAFYADKMRTKKCPDTYYTGMVASMPPAWWMARV